MLKIGDSTVSVLGVAADAAHLDDAPGHDAQLVSSTSWGDQIQWELKFQGSKVFILGSTHSATIQAIAFLQRLTECEWLVYYPQPVVTVGTLS